MSEIQYAIRRADGEPMFGEYGWSGCEDPGDWEDASLDSECSEEPAGYAMVRLTIAHVRTRDFLDGKPVDGKPIRLPRVEGLKG